MKPTNCDISVGQIAAIWPGVLYTDVLGRIMCYAAFNDGKDVQVFWQHVAISSSVWGPIKHRCYDPQILAINAGNSVTQDYTTIPHICRPAPLDALACAKYPGTPIFQSAVDAEDEIRNLCPSVPARICVVPTAASVATAAIQNALAGLRAVPPGKTCATGSGAPTRAAYRPPADVLSAIAPVTLRAPRPELAKHPELPCCGWCGEILFKDYRPGLGLHNSCPTHGFEAPNVLYPKG